MHDRAEMRAGAATRATASATEIMILLNIGYVIAQDTPRVESFNETHPPNVENFNLFRPRSPTPWRDARCG